MTHIVIAVNREKWLLYNFNGSHPVFPFDDNFQSNVLYALIPKIAAPVKAPKISEFVVRRGSFDPDDRLYKNLVDDMVNSGALLEKTGLYPQGKLVDDLPFRNEFYRWIGKIHLDGRSGMSYGFLARQMPVKLPKLIPVDEARARYKEALHSIIYQGRKSHSREIRLQESWERGVGNGNPEKQWVLGRTRNDELVVMYISDEEGFFVHDSKVFIYIQLPAGKFYLQIPDVWVLIQRSGTNKTNIRPEVDIVKIGLVDGVMILETPKGLKNKEDYRPSFDTRVILAHAVGNAIVGAVLLYMNPGHPFPGILQKNGLALSHWHGYSNRSLVPEGWHVYGAENPHVSCSTPHAAIYALKGKFSALEQCLKNNADYLGDIHIEPHHGSIMSFTSLREWGAFVSNTPNFTRLGNYYLSSSMERCY